MAWRRQLSRVAGMGPRALAGFVALGVAVAALTALDAAGKLTRVDQFAVGHLMTGLQPSRTDENVFVRFLLPFSHTSSLRTMALDTWAYPCSVVNSLLVLAAVAVVLRRRGRPLAGLAWIGAWVIGNGIEVVGKGVIVRPALYGASGQVRFHVSAFDQSYPSGHSIRCVLVAGAVVFAWRRLAPPVIAWGLLVAPALVLSAAHTPSDVAGGAGIGLMLLLLAWTISDGDRPAAGANFPAIPRS